MRRSVVLFRSCSSWARPHAERSAGIGWFFVQPPQANSEKAVQGDTPRPMNCRSSPEAEADDGGREAVVVWACVSAAAIGSAKNRRAARQRFIIGISLLPCDGSRGSSGRERSSFFVRRSSRRRRTAHDERR